METPLPNHLARREIKQTFYEQTLQWLAPQTKRLADIFMGELEAFIDASVPPSLPLRLCREVAFSLTNLIDIGERHICPQCGATPTMGRIHAALAEMAERNLEVQILCLAEMRRLNVARTADDDDRLQRAMATPLAQMELDVRTINALEEKGIRTAEDLLNTSEAKLLAIPNIGPRVLANIYKAISKLAFSTFSAQNLG